MRFAIDADGRRGLRVIEEIPDLGVCRLEGYNRIGKSTAIRLLQMCTGVQPYEQQEHLWRTFRDQLASARVVATRLHDAEQIEWVLDPSGWPPGPEPLGNRLGQVRINGHPARSTDVPTLLRVDRIAGDETFTDTLAARVTSAGIEVRRWMAEGGQGWQRRAGLDHTLDEWHKRVTEYDLAAFQADRRKVEEAERLASRLRTDLQAAEERVKVLSEAQQLLDQLDDVRGRGPGLDQQLEDLDRQLGEWDSKRTELDGQILTLGQREQHNQQAHQEFQRAQQHLGRRERDLGEARVRLADAAGTAQVPPDRAAATAARDSANAQLEDLLSQQARVNTTPHVIRLAEDLSGRLRQAEEDGLGEEVLVESVSASASWTTRQLREALQRQAIARAAQPLSAPAERLEEQVNQVRARIQSLAEVLEACELVTEAARRLRQAKQRMQEATSALPASTARTVQELLTARSQLDAQIVVLATRRGQVEQAKSLLGGGLTEPVLAERLTRACQAVEVDASQLGGELADAAGHLEVRAAALVAQRQARELRAELVERIRRIGRTVATLHEAPAAAWLRTLGDQLPMPAVHAEVDEQLQMLARLGAGLDAARTRLTAFTGHVQAIGPALLELSTQLRERRPGSITMDWLPEVRKWLAREVGLWFDHAEIREALFPGGGEVELDLAEMTVSWTPAREERQTRSLLAFSSGEQAFAYTRARLASLDLECEHCGEPADRIGRVRRVHRGRLDAPSGTLPARTTRSVLEGADPGRAAGVG
jgi:chromosome segregation ATPase